MSRKPDTIACPHCGGDGVLDCSAGCPGDDRLCLTCGGRGPERCGCWGGTIPQPAFCPGCSEDDAVEWEEHELFAGSDLTALWREGRLSLTECLARPCAHCWASLVAAAGGGAS